MYQYHRRAWIVNSRARGHPRPAAAEFRHALAAGSRNHPRRASAAGSAAPTRVWHDPAAMQRLAADGYLTRLPCKERNAYVHPRVGEEALTLQVLHQILDGLAADYPSAVAAYVARHDSARIPHLRLVLGGRSPAPARASS